MPDEQWNTTHVGQLMIVIIHQELREAALEESMTKLTGDQHSSKGGDGRRNQIFEWMCILCRDSD